jgi:hypothetical protein
MATGDQNDALARLQSLLPRWFGDFSNTPVLNAVLQGFAWCIAWVYTLIQYAALQTRIKTATDGFLDMISADFFGTGLPRSPNQTDASFRARIIANLLRERATRKGLIQVLIDVTGRAPKVFEPLRILDAGAYGALCGYGVAGGYGSFLLPFQCFVTAFRPTGTGIPNVAGYGVVNSAPIGAGYDLWGNFIPSEIVGNVGGYGVPSKLEYGSLSMIQGGVLDSDIYAAIDSVKPAATIVWTHISN